MVTIQVVKPFIFQHDPVQTGSYKDKDDKVVPVFALEGEQQKFEVGFHEVSEAVADHWYVRAHLAGFEQPAPQKAQADYAFQMRALQAGKAGRNGTSVAEAAPPPAPLPPGVQTQEKHYFAGGGPKEDLPPPEAPSWMR